MDGKFLFIIFYLAATTDKSRTDQLTLVLRIAVEHLFIFPNWIQFGYIGINERLFFANFKVLLDFKYVYVL